MSSKMSVLCMLVFLTVATAFLISDHLNCHHGHSVSGPIPICKCDDGWEGWDCNQPDPCNSKPCQNGGTCKHHRQDQWTLQYYCSCQTGYTGKNCEVPPATLSQAITTITTSTARTTTTTPAAGSVYYCNKFETVNAVGLQIVSTNIHATACQSGENASPEALVLEHCNVSLPSSWHQDRNVMSSCSDVALYTPIAVFVNGVYTPNNDVTSGIFLGCLPNGFKIVMQACDSFPTIAHAETATAIDPRGFYVIQ